MARNSYTFFTPLGTFASSGQAAAAHKCDKSTIMARCASDPDNYRRVVREPRAVTTGKWHTRREWPLSWSQYRGLDFEIREQIYETWCTDNQRDPNTDSAAEDFFDAMDLLQDVIVVESELDQDIESELSEQ
jgi:hypothetical protein